MLDSSVFQRMYRTAEGCLKEQNIHYRVVAEDNMLYDERGAALGSIFSYSYFRVNEDSKERRPVIFACNGGPGSSSLMLHAGFLGARRVYYDQFPSSGGSAEGKSIDNPDSLLDGADVVLFDPVATGYGRLLDPDSTDRFFGIEEDAEATLQFVSGWLSRYQRWDCPKYLLGESYGSTRVAVMAGLAQGGSLKQAYNICFDGVILIGNTVSPSSYHKTDLKVEPSVLNFSSFAATRWYHHRPANGQALEEFVQEADNFAGREYLWALYQGDALQGEQRRDIERKISYYTGVSGKYLEANSLQINHVEYLSEVLKSRGRKVSIYDSRFAVPQYDGRGGRSDPFKDDPVLNLYEKYFRSVFEQSICPSLGMETERYFCASCLSVQKIWNFHTEYTPAQQLTLAMCRNEKMRTFFINGYYDLCTQSGLVRYTMRHSGLPVDRTFLKEYPSGHMIYMGEDNCRQVAGDIRNFIRGINP
ncbi:MAG: hypothetical protein LUH19_03120 [Lachnospiraceae bacterium]|nr:hypothetical protein [Lachnospiraceae bacterium]